MTAPVKLAIIGPIAFEVLFSLWKFGFR